MTLKTTEMRVPRWVQRLGELPKTVAQEALAEAQGTLQEALRKNASKGGPRGLHVRTGRLLRSIRTYLKATPDGGELSVSMAFYGWLHNRQTAPTSGRIRRFPTPRSDWRSAQRSMRPAQGWADDALDETAKQYPRYIHQALERALRQK